MPLDLTDNKSTLVQVMAWYRQVTRHYLSQCWPRSLSPNGVTRPQWVKLKLRHGCHTPHETELDYMPMPHQLTPCAYIRISFCELKVVWLKGKAVTKVILNLIYVNFLWPNHCLLLFISWICNEMQAGWGMKGDVRLCRITLLHIEIHWDTISWYGNISARCELRIMKGVIGTSYKISCHCCLIMPPPEKGYQDNTSSHLEITFANNSDI